MLKYYESLIQDLQSTQLVEWTKKLPEIIETGLNHQRYGDLKQWQSALEQLPNLNPESVDYSDTITISGIINKEQDALIEQCFRELIPWRKGPFQVFNTFIDTEWRSDWKWQRVEPHIQPLGNRRVLDVGCGNGYHCLRMYGSGSPLVLGIDPSPRFVVQFYMLKHFLGNIPVNILPCTLDEMPPTPMFDTVFSMGVLYHRRSPLDHIKQLMGMLRPGGELVLETLIIEGNDREALIPHNRYAKMPNVWFLPSSGAMINWLTRCGLKDVKCVDVNRTSTQEQRATDWMTFQSLSDFLDPNDPEKTVEGYPAPLRGIFVATI